MIYFIFPFDLGLFWGNQALTVCPVLWLSCLHSSAGEMLTLRRRAELLSGSGQYLDLSVPDAGKDRSSRAKRGGKDRLAKGQEE